MDAATIWTVVLGLVGVLAVTGVSVFTQLHQGRRQDLRDRRARLERDSAQLRRSRFEAYKRYLACLERETDLYGGLGAETLQQRTSAQVEQARATRGAWSELALVATSEVVRAVEQHDLASSRRDRAWLDHHVAQANGEPETTLSGHRDALHAAKRDEAEARRRIYEAVRQELGRADEALDRLAAEAEPAYESEYEPVPRSRSFGERLRGALPRPSQHPERSVSRVTRRSREQRRRDPEAR